MDIRPTPLPTKFLPALTPRVFPRCGRGVCAAIGGYWKALCICGHCKGRTVPAPSFPGRCNIPVPACGSQEHGGCPKPTREGRRGQTPDPPRSRGKKIHHTIKSSQAPPPPPRSLILPSPPKKRAAFQIHSQDFPALAHVSQPALHPCPSSPSVSPGLQPGTHRELSSPRPRCPRGLMRPGRAPGLRLRQGSPRAARRAPGPGARRWPPGS